MSKAQSKTKHDTKTMKQLWIGLAVLGLLFVIAICCIVGLHQALRAEVELDRRFMAYDHAMLTFCHDRDIKPCDNNSIWNWNDDHATDKFEYKTRQELVNEQH